MDTRRMNAPWIQSSGLLFLEMCREFPGGAAEHGRESEQEANQCDDRNCRVIDEQCAVFAAIDNPHRNGGHKSEQRHRDDRRNGSNQNAFYIDHSDFPEVWPRDGVESTQEIQFKSIPRTS
jgi:hypothetical protein